MHLVDRAENILGRFIVQPELTDGRIVLIGHSLGGLVIKQLFRTLEMKARARLPRACSTGLTKSRSWRRPILARIWRYGAIG
jgi:hypothetical protein